MAAFVCVCAEKEEWGWEEEGGGASLHVLFTFTLSPGEFMRAGW